MADCNRILGIDPNDPGAYYIRGTVHEKMNMLNESIEDFTSVLHIDPNHFNAAYARGACENKRGNYLKAIEDYNFALEKDKRLNASHRKIPLASVNYMLDSNDKEIELMGSISETKLNPEEVKSTNIIQNKYEEEHNSSPQISEMSSGLSNWKGDLNEIQKKPNMQYIPSLKPVNEKNSTEADKYHNQGYEARRKGDYAEAIRMYTKAIDLCDNFFKAYFNRGFAWDKLGEYEKAITDYAKALEIEPKNAFIYYNRGVSLDKLQRYDEAIYNFSMAITLDPNKADFYHNRGFAFRKKLDYEKAIQDYNKAIELNPSHFKVYIK